MPAGYIAANETISSPLANCLAMRDRDTIDMVRNAVRHGEVMLAYQPVVQGADTGRTAFYEGLIRVLDETGRVIPAGDFMNAVETTELGRQLDCAALRMGLEALAATPGLRLSINMSARSIGYTPWLDTLRRGLAECPTVAERLILEITESSAMIMPELVSRFMRDLQRRGISFALDDFGAGYTAFRYLRDFYFDIVKIDGGFSKGIAGSPDNQVLMRSLIDIAGHFDMFTVAEAVESAEDAAFLTGLGIDCLQGYYFAAPTIHPPFATKVHSRMSA